MRGFAVGLFGMLPATALAGPIDLYGIGGAQIGRGGGGVAILDEPAGVFLNPAALVRMKRPEAMVGYALLRADFPDSPDVLWDTNRDGLINDTDKPLSVATDPDKADGFSFALGRPVGERFALSIAGFMPNGRLVRIHTFEPSLPNWFLYENRAHRYELAVGFGWEQLKGVSLGGAVEMLSRVRYQLDITMNVPVGLASDGQQLGEIIGPISLDPHEMVIDIVPSLAPIAALHWDVGEQFPALDGLLLGASWRGAVGLPVDVTVDLQANLGLQANPSAAPVPVTLLAPLRLALLDHYVPSRVVVGAGFEQRWGRVYAEAQRQGWDQMRLNVASVQASRVETQLFELAEPEIQDGNPYDIVLQATWGLRGGGEYRFAPLDGGPLWGPVGLTVRAGAGYEPTPLVAQGEGTAFLDADRILLAAGAGVSHDDPFNLTIGPMSWDAFAEMGVLAAGALQPGGDPDRAGAPVDDAPIPIGGRIWSAGLTWSFAY